MELIPLSLETVNPDTDQSLRDRANGTVETLLWLDEHEWLYTLLKSEQNVSPTFRFPDLISACVAIVFDGRDPADRIFEFLWSELVLRPPNSVRRREAMWRPQYELLLELQKAPRNRHPNPKFQLDHFTTACVALVKRDGYGPEPILQRARMNMAERSATWRFNLPS